MLFIKTIYRIARKFNNIHPNKISNKKITLHIYFIFTDGIFTNAESTHTSLIYTIMTNMVYMHETQSAHDNGIKNLHGYPIYVSSSFN